MMPPTQNLMLNNIGSWKWAFQEYFMKSAENDCERACGYGIAFHLVTDYVFHNYFVPEQIRTYYCPNFPCHPIYEVRPEAFVIKEHPEEFARLQYSLKTILNNPQMLNKFAKAVTMTISSGTGYSMNDVKNDIKRFDEVIGNPEGFYTRVFGIPDIYKSVAYGNRTYGIILLIPGIILIALSIKYKKKFFMVMPIIFLILPGGFLLIGGITGITSNIDSEKYLNMCIDKSVEIFSPQGWETRYNLDATGYAMISQADSQIMVVWTLIIIGLISLISIYIYTKVRKRR